MCSKGTGDAPGQADALAAPGPTCRFILARDSEMRMTASSCRTVTGMAGMSLPSALAARLLCERLWGGRAGRAVQAGTEKTLCATMTAATILPTAHQQWWTIPPTPPPTTPSTTTATTQPHPLTSARSSTYSLASSLAADSVMRGLQFWRQYSMYRFRKASSCRPGAV